MSHFEKEGERKKEEEGSVKIHTFHCNKSYIYTDEIRKILWYNRVLLRHTKVEKSKYFLYTCSYEVPSPKTDHRYIKTDRRPRTKGVCLSEVSDLFSDKELLNRSLQQDIEERALSLTNSEL